MLICCTDAYVHHSLLIPSSEMGVWVQTLAFKVLCVEAFCHRIMTSHLCLASSSFAGVTALTSQKVQNL